MKRLEISKIYAKLSWAEFKKFHAEKLEYADTMTALERYVSIGGKPPKAKKSEGAE